MKSIEAAGRRLPAKLLLAAAIGLAGCNSPTPETALTIPACHDTSGRYDFGVTPLSKLFFVPATTDGEVSAACLWGNGSGTNLYLLRKQEFGLDLTYALGYTTNTKDLNVDQIPFQISPPLEGEIKLSVRIKEFGVFTLTLLHCFDETELCFNLKVPNPNEREARRNTHQLLAQNLFAHNFQPQLPRQRIYQRVSHNRIRQGRFG